MYVKENDLNIQELDNQADAYRSTVVYFVENKIDKIKLRIPLPFLNYNLENSLKIKEVDILYKESDSLAVKVVDTLTIDDVSNSAGSFTVNGAVTNDATIIIDNLQGGINVGDIISGTGIVGQPKVLTYTPTDVNNPSLGGEIVLNENQTLEDDAVLQAGEPSYYVYNYLSKKPFKTLPEKDLTRVYDKIPVRSLSQEVAGNRVIYGNYQDKHTPPKALNYNVAVSNKSEFQLNKDEGTYIDGGRVVPSGDPINIDMLTGSALFPGRAISSDTPGVTIPPNTLVSSTNNNGDGVFITGLLAFSGTSDDFLVKETNGFIPVGAVVSGNGVIPGTTVLSVVVGGGSLGDNEQYVTCSSIVTLVENQPIYFGSTSQTETIISLSNEVTFPAGVVDLNFKPESSVVDYTSSLEYPNSSLKQNRNYQAGIILSDRYSRTSTVILSNNKDTIRAIGQSFSGSTVYSPYNDISQAPSDWPGDSIKLLFNEAINSTKNLNTGTPGLYNGDPTSADYNPLGWYSFKIVVKQTEQEYYNVYLPGIMASYPDDTTLELGNTSHTVLINDNINKIPRDLSEVGPQQKQFRSSVQLYGRVENTNIEITPSTNLGESNMQYYPGRSSDTVSTISTLNDLFEYDPSEPPRPNYFPQLYLIESNPLVARISTESKIGQISTTNFNTITASIAESATTDTFRLVDIAGDFSTIVPGDIVLGKNFPEDLTVVQTFESAPAGTALAQAGSPAAGEKQIKVDNIPTSGAGNGTLVTGNGVPNGTAITGIDVTTSPYTIEVNNTVNVPLNAPLTYTTAPQLKVSSAQTVTLDQDITIIPDATPGIQYLAVYETKPVESLLDIFWETSSSGLISDLNNAIINDSSAGAGLSEFNQTPFTEGLAENANVLSAPFYIIDNFGSLISINEINEPLELTQVTNQLGQNITNLLNYFTLVQTPNTNEFQIQATTAYYNDIYFGEEGSSSPQDLRNFSLRFQATVNDQPLDVTRELILANERPVITFPSDGANINTTNNVQNITTIKCVNGANNLNLQSIFQSGNCTITSQTIFGQTEQVNYFAIDPNPTPVSNEAHFQLINTDPGNVPVERYRLEICVEDAGGANDKDCIEIFIDFGVKIRNVKQYGIRRRFKRLRNKPDGPGSPTKVFGDLDNWYQFYTVFQAWSGGDSNAWGWYLYNGPWSSQSREDGLNGVTTSTTYGVDNFPNAFIWNQEYAVPYQVEYFEYPGIGKKDMKGTELPPLVDALGGNGVITIEFADVNTSDPNTGYNESFRWVPISEQESDVIQLWENSSEIREWCYTLFPSDDIGQRGNYSKFPPPEGVQHQNFPNLFNPAPNDTTFGAWNGWNSVQNPNQFSEITINENNYSLNGVTWQIVV